MQTLYEFVKWDIVGAKWGGAKTFRPVVALEYLYDIILPSILEEPQALQQSPNYSSTVDLLVSINYCSLNTA